MNGCNQGHERPTERLNERMNKRASQIQVNMDSRRQDTSEDYNRMTVQPSGGLPHKLTHISLLNDPSRYFTTSTLITKGWLKSENKYTKQLKGWVQHILPTEGSTFSVVRSRSPCWKNSLVTRWTT